MSEYGADHGPLYPILAKGGPGVELIRDEDVVASHPFGLINIAWRLDGTWRQVAHFEGNPGTLSLTNKRLVIAFDKVPKTRSMFTPIAAAQALRDVGKHRGEGCAGHLYYEWINGIAARKRTMAPPAKKGMLRIIVAVKSADGSRRDVMVEINKDKSPEIATQIAQSLYRNRVEHPIPTQTDEILATWRAEAQAGFDAPPREFAVRSFAPSILVPEAS